MIDTLHLFVIGFNRPDLLREQHRLLDKYLEDAWTLALIDNTPEERDARGMAVTAEALGVEYIEALSEPREHTDGLRLAAALADIRGYDYWGVLDHDIFPTEPCALIDKIRAAGFYGMGQTYAPRVGPTLRYLWPGWAFFSREWLAGRTPDFGGIRGDHKFDDGDAGSLLHPLFTEDDWDALPPVEHAYGMIRPEDEHGLQSFGYETMGPGWLHLTNSSHWKVVPDPADRDRLLRLMVAEL